jgi:hypothetical protein
MLIMKRPFDSRKMMKGSATCLGDLSGFIDDRQFFSSNLVVIVDQINLARNRLPLRTPSPEERVGGPLRATRVQYDLIAAVGSCYYLTRRIRARDGTYVLLTQGGSASVGNQHVPPAVERASGIVSVVAYPECVENLVCHDVRRGRQDRPANAYAVRISFILTGIGIVTRLIDVGMVVLI